MYENRPNGLLCLLASTYVRIWHVQESYNISITFCQHNRHGRFSMFIYPSVLGYDNCMITWCACYKLCYNFDPIVVNNLDLSGLLFEAFQTRIIIIIFPNNNLSLLRKCYVKSFADTIIKYWHQFCWYVCDSK
jgi:hypothetical protein